MLKGRRMSVPNTYKLPPNHSRFAATQFISLMLLKGTRKTKIGRRGRLRNQIRNEFEHSAQFFCAQCSTRWPSAQYFRSNIQRNYQSVSSWKQGAWTTNKQKSCASGLSRHRPSGSLPIETYRYAACSTLYWLLGTSVPKTGRENSFCHTRTTYNSRQAYASFLNSRQLYEGRDRKISSFSFPTSCSKEGFCGKIMSSEAAKLRVKSQRSGLRHINFC